MSWNKTAIITTCTVQQKKPILHVTIPDAIWVWLTITL